MGVSPARLVYGQDLWLLVDMLLGHFGRVPAADTFAQEHQQLVEQGHE